MSNQPNRAALITALEQERERVLGLLPRFTDTQWRAVARADGWTVHDIVNHLADSTYGLALIALDEGGAALPTDSETGRASPHELNEQRRQKNRDLPREKLQNRMASAFDHARRAVETVDDYDRPASFGRNATSGFVLQRIVDHAAEHRAELEAFLGSDVN